MQKTGPSIHSAHPAETLREFLATQGSDKETEEQESPQLRIAWQYRRYIQRQQLQQQSGLSSLQEDLAMPGMPSLQSASLGRLTSAPAKGEGKVVKVDSAVSTHKSWPHSESIVWSYLGRRLEVS